MMVLIAQTGLSNTDLYVFGKNDLMAYRVKREAAVIHQEARRERHVTPRWR